jgi:hypothetical protein
MCAAEFEEIAFQQIQLARQRFAQQILGAEVPASRRLLGNVQRCRRFLDAQFLDRTEHEDEAESFRQLIDLAFKQFTHLATPRCCVW